MRRDFDPEPPRKTVKLQRVSIFVITSNPATLSAEVDFTSGGSHGVVYVPLSKGFVESSPASLEAWSAAVNVHIYADPGSKVSLTVISLDTIENRSLAISGYLS